MELPGSTWVPVDSCTLPTAEQPLQVAEFDDLFGTSLRSVERSPTRATLTFSGDETLADRVQRLADAETVCCSFFTFTVTERGGRTTLDVEVPERYAHVLAALVDRANRAVA
jgi:hypothetical protein